MAEQKDIFVSTCSIVNDRSSMMFGKAADSSVSDEAKRVECFGMVEGVSLDPRSSLSGELNEGLVSDRGEFSTLQENESRCGSVASMVVVPMTLTGVSKAETSTRDENACTLGYGKRVDEGIEMASTTNKLVDSNNEVDGGYMNREPVGEDCLKEDKSRCNPHLPLINHETLSSVLKSSSEQGSASIGVSSTSLDNEVLTNSTIEGMDTDDFNEQFCFSVEELQESTEAVNGCTENQNNAIADNFIPYRLTQVVGDNVLQNAGSISGNQFCETIPGRVGGNTQVTNIKSNGCFSLRHSNEAIEVDEVSALDFKGSTDVKVSGSELKTYSRMSLRSRVLPLMFVNNEGSEKMECFTPLQVESEWDESIKLEDQVIEEQDTSKGEYGYQNSMCIKPGMVHSSVMMDLPLQNKGDATKLNFGNQEHSEGDQGNEERMDGDIPGFNPYIKRGSVREQFDCAESDGLQEVYVVEAQEHCTGSGKTSFIEEHDKSEFSVSDLVWGKVRSHPWWPGQIFDASDASEKAMKYYRNDCFLVAYFGDRTFAWNEASLLKPFRSYFSHVEKQSNSEAFQHAVSCALDEVARRVELGLACSCVPQEDLERMKYQVVENTGIQAESSTRESMDSCLGSDLFNPKQLTEQIKSLALCPTDEADRLDLVIARAQLQAFSRLKGSSLRELVSFEDSDGLQFEEDQINEHSSLPGFGDTHIMYGEVTSEHRSAYHKRKHNLKDGNYVRNRDKITFDSITETWDSFSDDIDLLSPSGKTWRGTESSAEEYLDGKKSISLGRVSSIPKPSFKIGECIRRVASQMTGSPSILKCNNQKADGFCEGIADVSDSTMHPPAESETKTAAPLAEYSAVDDLLAYFIFLAEHPYRKHNIPSTIMSFFLNFRNSVIINQHDKAGRMKEVPYLGGSPETFEFEDMSDTYWTDRVIQNGSEDQQLRRGRKRQNLLVSGDADKRYRRSNSKKQQSSGNADMSSDKPDENAPAELVMHFPVVDSVPSEANLSRMFKRFGPLKESETEVDRNTNRARVVFKKSSDAEAAYSSASKFNIFGQTLVNYQLNYTISVPFKSPALVTSLGDEDVTLFLEF